MRAFICLAILQAAMLAGCSIAEPTVGAFASSTVDVGIVVSDVDKAVAFYRDAIGFTEVKGFDVPAVMGGDSGLTDNRPFRVRVMVLADRRNATKVKLMQFAEAPPARQDTRFINSTLGMRYLTVYVNDMAAAVARAKQAGAAPLAKGPYLLPEGFPKDVYLTVVRDPDGNMIELVGPNR